MTSRPYQPGDRQRVELAVERLQHARDLLRLAGVAQAARRAGVALPSAEAALRRAARLEALAHAVGPRPDPFTARRLGRIARRRIAPARAAVIRRAFEL